MAHRRAPSVRNDDPEMAGQRARNDTGRLRAKRGDTRIDTIEAQYHVNLGVRGDMHLDTLRERTGKTLSELLEEAKRRG